VTMTSSSCSAIAWFARVTRRRTSSFPCMQTPFATGASPARPYT
jgi:hypothetical protein